MISNYHIKVPELYKALLKNYSNKFNKIKLKYWQGPVHIYLIYRAYSTQQHQTLKESPSWLSFPTCDWHPLPVFPLSLTWAAQALLSSCLCVTFIWWMTPRKNRLSVQTLSSLPWCSRWVPVFLLIMSASLNIIIIIVFWYGKFSFHCLTDPKLCPVSQELSVKLITMKEEKNKIMLELLRGRQKDLRLTTSTRRPRDLQQIIPPQTILRSQSW